VGPRASLTSNDDNMTVWRNEKDVERSGRGPRGCIQKFPD